MASTPFSRSLRVSTMLALVLACGVGVPRLAAQEIRVHVLPAVNRTGQAQFDVVAMAVTDTVTLTLRLIDRYVLGEGVPDRFADQVPLPAVGRGRSELLAEMAATLPAENIVFGEIVSASSGSGEAGRGNGNDTAGRSAGDTAVPELVLSVYDRLEGRVVLTERRRPETLFEIFTATDELTAALLTSFSGRRVTFGSLRIVPTIAGSDEAPRAAAPDYVVTLDGQTLGQNLRSIDSILTGEHTLTVTTEIDGEVRTVYDEEIRIAEGAATRVEVLLPNVALLEAEQATARRTEAEEAKQDLAEALAALSEERQNNQYELAREYYLEADSFIDPVAIRAAARENAAQAAGFEITRGQRLLSEREWERGIASHRLVAELGQTFESPDLFGHQAEVGLVARNWAEYTVQRERKPIFILPFGVSLWALNFAASANFGDGPGDRVSNNHAMYVPLVPALITSGFMGLWNATDWSFRASRRSLERYGAGGAESNRMAWRPKKWELHFGAYMGGAWSTMPLDQPVDVGSSAGLVSFGFGKGTNVSVTAAVRRWFSLVDGVAVRFRQGLGFDDDDLELVLDDNGDDEIWAKIPQRQLLHTTLTWVHTRTGGAILEAGFTYRASQLLVSEIQFSDQAVDSQFVRNLLGDDPIIHTPGLTIGTGWRIGRTPRKPWELLVNYELQRVQFPDEASILAEGGPYYYHGVHVTFVRAIFLGDEVVATESLERGTFDAQRTEAEERWKPLPLSWYVDPGGILGWGPRVGLSWNLNRKWSFLIYGRNLIGDDRVPFSRVGSTSDIPLAGDLVAPGFGVRRFVVASYQNGLPVSGPFFGMTVEYLNVHGLVGQFDEETEFLNFGWAMATQLEAGYRLPVWRRAVLDLGVQAGLQTSPDPIGATVEFDDGADSTEEYTARSTEFCLNFVVAVSCPIF